MINNVGASKFQTLNSFGISVNNIRKVPDQTVSVTNPGNDTPVNDSIEIIDKKVADFKSRLKGKK